MDNVYGLLGQMGDYGELILAIIGVCAALAAFVPAPKDGDSKAYRIFHSVLNTLAANVKHARNAPDYDNGETEKKQ